MQNKSLSMGRMELAQSYFPFLLPRSAWNKFKSLLLEYPELSSLVKQKRRTYLPAIPSRMLNFSGILKSSNVPFIFCPERRHLLPLRDSGRGQHEPPEGDAEQGVEEITPRTILAEAMIRTENPGLAVRVFV